MKEKNKTSNSDYNNKSQNIWKYLIFIISIIVISIFYTLNNINENINVEFYGVDNKKIWQKLFNNKNLENIYSDNDMGKYTLKKFT